MSRDSSSKQNDTGPDYFGYYKKLILELFPEKNTVCPIIAFAEPSAGRSNGVVPSIQIHDEAKTRQSFGSSASFFTDGIGRGLSEHKKERFKDILHETAVVLNQEVDEIVGQVLAALQTESYQRQNLFSGQVSGSDEDMAAALCSKKRKTSSPSSSCCKSNVGLPKSEAVGQVFRDIQAIQGNPEISQETVEKYSSGLLAKLCEMEHNLDEFLNEVVSCSR